MKKKNIIAILAFALVGAMSLLFYSCHDESGVYVSKLYTDTQKKNAIKACLTASCDSASNHLFKHDGFYNGKSRIDFHPVRSTLFDTLNKYGESALVDSLILITNRMAEGCGGQLTPIVKSAIDTLEIINADYLLNGNSGIITEYFKNNEYQLLKSSFQMPVSIRMNLLGINSLWNELANRYSEYSQTPVNFDVQSYIIDNIVNGIIEEMKIEEGLIRSDESHRNDTMDPFGN